MEIKHDKVEESEEYKMIVDEVDRKAKERVNAFVQRQVDECDDILMREFIKSLPTSYRFCYEKKIILKEEYGIEWESCIELNPEINFD